MEEDSKDFTAFTVGPLGFYKCECMPCGLTNAPATVIVFSKTPDEHLLRLRAVFEKLKQVGVKLKPSKCELFRQELIYLGHVVSKNGIQTDP